MSQITKTEHGKVKEFIANQLSGGFQPGRKPQAYGQHQQQQEEYDPDDYE